MCLIKPRREGETDAMLALKAKLPTYVCTFFRSLTESFYYQRFQGMMKKNQGCYSLISPFFSVSYQHFNLKFSGHIWETCELASRWVSLIHHQCLSPLITHSREKVSLNLDEYRLFNFRCTSNFKFKSSLTWQNSIRF